MPPFESFEVDHQDSASSGDPFAPVTSASRLHIGVVVYYLPSGGLAVAGWPAKQVLAFAAAGSLLFAIGFIKLPAETLLAHPLQVKWGTQLVATDVASESERARLAALGVPLMTGHAVSGPCVAALPMRGEPAPMVNRL